MALQIFLSAVERIAANTLPLDEVIQASEALSPTEPGLCAQLYRLWIAANPDSPHAFAAHFNLSVLLDRLGDSAAAEASLREALRLSPDLSAAAINLGGVLERRGDVAGALETWRIAADRLVGVSADTITAKATLLKQISRIVTDLQDHATGEIALAHCLDITPDARDVSEQYCATRLAQCKWPPLAGIGRIGTADLIKRLHPLSACAYSDDPLLQLAISAEYVRTLSPPASRNRASDRRNAVIEADRPLRIGYVSSDLRFHAVGFLMAEVFELHDRDRFEITAYYCGPPSQDALHGRYQQTAHRWRDIRRLSDDDAAALIAADGIDILIDVNGHTREARLGVFARRPAPIQVNWLGYPGTMGSPFHHYIIADAFIAPPQAQTLYSETILHLPCYQPNDRRRIVSPQTPSRAEAGLPDDAFVLCSFNASHKITRASFERWLAILEGVDTSVLWLLDYSPTTNARLRAYAQARGVAPERLIFAPKLTNPHHMARIALADLVVDTAPYGAHTTASDALWMGVPVLTFAGRCFASRVCGSLVTAAGLPQLVCDTPEAFIDRAIALATTHRDELSAMRAHLKANRDQCTLFDTPLLVRSLEALYAQMAATHRAGATPRPHIANLAVYGEIGAGFDHQAEEIGLRADYFELYRSALALRHHAEPMAPDGRLWTQDDIAGCEEGTAPTAHTLATDQKAA